MKGRRSRKKEKEKKMMKGRLGQQAQQPPGNKPNDFIHSHMQCKRIQIHYILLFHQQTLPFCLSTTPKPWQEMETNTSLKHPYDDCPNLTEERKEDQLYAFHDP
jgi:hypothetical protein